MITDLIDRKTIEIWTFCVKSIDKTSYTFLVFLKDILVDIGAFQNGF